MCMSSEWATVVDVAAMMEELLKPHGAAGASLLLKKISFFMKARPPRPSCTSARRTLPVLTIVRALPRSPSSETFE